jgi:RNA binding exosome subunit
MISLTKNKATETEITITAIKQMLNYILLNRKREVIFSTEHGKMWMRLNKQKLEYGSAPIVSSDQINLCIDVLNILNNEMSSNNI